MARKTVKVEIPDNPLELLDLFKKVLAKNAADGNKSLLGPLNMALMQSDYTKADAHNEEMKRLYGLAKIETEARDNLFGSIQKEETMLFVLGQVRNLLLSVYAANPRELAKWGFTVVEGEAPVGRKKPPAK